MGGGGEGGWCENQFDRVASLESVSIPHYMTPFSVTSSLGLNCLLMSILRDIKHKLFC